eukprot:GHVT01096434.1.p1 GENE.GHVT01096434.1~~GHVT01096434.1.p1  ORF type:complete len:800 (-),score=84.60 GHVT01096434.1:440-2839(-)
MHEYVLLVFYLLLGVCFSAASSRGSNPVRREKKIRNFLIPVFLAVPLLVGAFVLMWQMLKKKAETAGKPARSKKSAGATQAAVPLPRDTSAANKQTQPDEPGQSDPQVPATTIADKSAHAEELSRTMDPQQGQAQDFAVPADDKNSQVEVQRTNTPSEGPEEEPLPAFEGPQFAGRRKRPVPNDIPQNSNKQKPETRSALQEKHSNPFERTFTSVVPVDEPQDGLRLQVEADTTIDDKSDKEGLKSETFHQDTPRQDFAEPSEDKDKHPKFSQAASPGDTSITFVCPQSDALQTGPGANKVEEGQQIPQVEKVANIVNAQATSLKASVLSQVGPQFIPPVENIQNKLQGPIRTYPVNESNVKPSTVSLSEELQQAASVTDPIHEATPKRSNTESNDSFPFFEDSSALDQNGQDATLTPQNFSTGEIKKLPQPHSSSVENQNNRNNNSLDKRKRSSPRSFPSNSSQNPLYQSSQDHLCHEHVGPQTPTFPDQIESEPTASQTSRLQTPQPEGQPQKSQSDDDATQQKQTCRNFLRTNINRVKNACRERVSSMLPGRSGSYSLFDSAAESSKTFLKANRKASEVKSPASGGLNIEHSTLLGEESNNSDSAAKSSKTPSKAKLQVQRILSRLSLGPNPKKYTQLDEEADPSDSAAEDSKTPSHAKRQAPTVKSLASQSLNTNNFALLDAESACAKVPPDNSGRLWKLLYLMRHGRRHTQPEQSISHPSLENQQNYEKQLRKSLLDTKSPAETSEAPPSIETSKSTNLFRESDRKSKSPNPLQSTNPFSDELKTANPELIENI